jgi:nucleoside-diphosphate-sugar epimerase
VPRGARRSGDEEAAPVTAYGRSKLAGERAVRRAGLPWVILRPPAVYGPFDTEMLRVFRAVKLGVVPVFGDGAQELSLVYGPDLARALAAAGRTAAAEGKILYPCHPEVITTTGLVRTVADAMTRKARLVPLPRWLARGALGVTGALARLAGRATLLTPDKAREFFAPAWTGDPAPLTAITGWEAEFDLARGAAATVAWYRERGLL